MGDYCLSSKVHITGLTIMIFLTTILSLFFVCNVSQAETFSEKLAVFVGETPNGYTVTQMIRDGQNCHCRVPASSSSSSSSSQFTGTTTATAGSSVFTVEVDATAAPPLTLTATGSAAPADTLVGGLGSLGTKQK